MKNRIIICTIIYCISSSANAAWNEAVGQSETPYQGQMNDLSGFGQIQSPPAASFGIATPLELNMASSEIPDSETTITPEIAAMARALKYNVVDIFNYVRNEIDYVPTYGLYNGATGCLLAGRGNDWDQSALLIALLRASGYTANFASAYVFYPETALQEWLNIDDPFKVASALAKGGHLVYGGGPGNQVIRRVWVEFLDGVSSVPLDPSFKEYDYIAGIALQDAMGYQSSNFLAQATAGATLGSDYVEQLNEPQIRTQLTTYVTNLVHTIKQESPSDTIEQIIGGYQLVEGSFVTGIPEIVAWDSDSYQSFSQIPATDHLTLRIVHSGIDETLKGYEIAGKRVSMLYDQNDGYKPLLRVDGNMVATGSGASQGSTNACTVYIEQPEAGGHVITTHSFNFIFGSKYLIAHDFESSSKKITQNHNRALQQARFENALNGSEEIVGGGMQVTMDAGQEAWRLSYALLAELADVRFNLNYFVGVLGLTDHGYYVDLPLIQLANTPRTSGADTNAFFEAAMYLISGLEHGVLEQSQGADHVCASTIKLLQINNSEGERTYLADSTNWSTIQNVLTNYTSADLLELNAAVAGGRRLLLPRDADIDLLDWTGIGYVDIGAHDIIMAIAGGYSGGYGANDSWEFSSSISQNNVGMVQVSFPDLNRNITTSLDPIDLHTGDFLYDHVDLSLGTMAFSSHYNSGQYGRKGPLGYGWTHGYDISVRRVSHSAPALGARRAEDAAARIVEGLVLLDLMKGDADVVRWTSAILTAKWGVDQLIENAVTVQLGSKSLEYIELPDGSYSPPPGETAVLVEETGHFVLKKRFDERLVFNPDGTIDSWINADGKGLAFGYDTSTNLQSVTDFYGRSLTLSYTNGLVASVSDSAGRSIFYQYADDNLTTYTDPESHDWNFGYADTNNPHLLSTLQDPLLQTTASNTYNRLGQVDVQRNGAGQDWEMFFTGVRGIEQDPEGGLMQYHFDGRGREVSTEDELHNISYTFYDGEGLLDLSIDPKFNITRHKYDGHQNLTNRTDALDQEWSYEYDAEQRLIAQTDPLGQIIHYEYDAAHHLVRILEPLGKETLRTYYTSGTHQGLLHTLTDANGNMTTYTYDSFGNPDTVASLDAGIVDFDYNARGERVKTTDALGNEILHTYNLNGNLLTTQFSDGSTNGITYWENDLLKETIDAKGQATTYTWTPTYKVSTVTYPNGGVVSNHYDSRDWLVATTDQQGNTTSNLHDLAGRVIGSVDPLGHQTDLHLDPNGNTTNFVVDPSGLDLWTQSHFDDLDRPVAVQTTLSTVQHQYDALSRVSNRVDAASKEWETQYDALGRMKKTFRPSGNYEEYGYDAVGNRTAFWNAERNTMNFGVDAQSRITSITNAIGKVTSFTFDDAGNLISRRDAEDAETIYEYDSLNRLTAMTNQGVEVATFDHDANGNVVEATSPSLASATYGYDEMNQLTSSTQTVGTATGIVGFQYDLNGNRTNIVYPDGLTVGYAYGDNNRLESVSFDGSMLASSKILSFGYDTANRLNGIAYPNGVNSTFGHDAEGRITSIEHGSFINRTIQRNVLGFKTTELIDAGIKPTAPTTGRKIKTHNDADQLTSEWVQEGTNEYTVSYDYSANGCLTNVHTEAQSTQSFAYDYDNRLESVSGGSPSSATEYLYGASGARVGRISGTTTNYFVVDYTDGLKRPLAETDSSGTVTRYYIWSGAQLLCHIEANGTIRYYHADELGSTLALTDESGFVTDQFAYMPYGYANHSGSADTPFQWLGGYGVYYDSDTDLHLTLHRAYSSKLKRFIHPDPLGIDGGVNLYAYGKLNPVFGVDPSGLITIQVGVTESGGAGTGQNVSHGYALSLSWKNGVELARYTTFGGGGHFGLSGGVGIELGASNNQSIDDLSGLTFEASGSGGILGKIGLQGNFVPEGGADPVFGGTFQFGAGGEVHSYGNQTIIHEKGIDFSPGDIASYALGKIIDFVTPKGPAK